MAVFNATHCYEDLRTSFSELCPLVTSCNNDLRKLLLLLQFWSESGASCYGSATDIHYDKKCLKDTLLSQRWESRDPALGLSNCSKTLTDQGSEDQFQKRQSSRLKRRDGPRRTRTSAREFTESVPGNEDRLENTVACLQNGENSEQERLVTKSFDDNTPLLEDMIFYSITGGSHYIEKWQSKSSSLQVGMCVCVCVCLSACAQLFISNYAKDVDIKLVILRAVM